VEIGFKKNNVLVSICIPAFNAEKYITDTILSIVNQDYKMVEIIVIDNCSTDNTLKVVLDLAAKFNNISVMNNHANIGMAGNWNKVIRLAKGDFVLLISADDQLDRTFITSALSDFKSNEMIDIVSFNFLLLKNGSLIQRKLNLASGIYRNFFELLVKVNPFSINFTMFSRRALHKLQSNMGLFVKNLMTCDYDLWFRIAENGLRVYYDDRFLGIYRVHSSNLSKIEKRRMLRQALLVLLSRKSYLNKRCFFSLKYAFYRMFLYYIYSIYLSRSFYKDRRLFRLLINNLLFW
jgi:glycosyltransferase involved in cell wall biosynthesis